MEKSDYVDRSRVEYAVADRTHVSEMLRIVRSLGKNLTGNHVFTPEEIEKERKRLQELDLYYAALEEKMAKALGKS